MTNVCLFTISVTAQWLYGYFIKGWLTPTDSGWRGILYVLVWILQHVLWSENLCSSLILSTSTHYHCGRSLFGFNIRDKTLEIHLQNQSRHLILIHTAPPIHFVRYMFHEVNKLLNTISWDRPYRAINIICAILSTIILLHDLYTRRCLATIYTCCLPSCLRTVPALGH